MKTAFTLAVAGTAGLGVIGFIADPTGVSSAIVKGVGGGLQWSAEKVLALIP